MIGEARSSIDVFRVKSEIGEPKRRESQKHEVWIEFLGFNGGGNGLRFAKIIE